GRRVLCSGCGRSFPVRADEGNAPAQPNGRTQPSPPPRGALPAAPPAAIAPAPAPPPPVPPAPPPRGAPPAPPPPPPPHPRAAARLAAPRGAREDQQGHRPRRGLPEEAAAGERHLGVFPPGGPGRPARPGPAGVRR